MGIQAWFHCWPLTPYIFSYILCPCNLCLLLCVSCNSFFNWLKVSSSFGSWKDCSLAYRASIHKFFILLSMLLISHSLPMYWFSMYWIDFWRATILSFKSVITFDLLLLVWLPTGVLTLSGMETVFCMGARGWDAEA